MWSCQKVCDALRYLLDNIFIRFGSKLYRQIAGIPMRTNCAPLVADFHENLFVPRHRKQDNAKQESEQVIFDV